MSRSGIWSLCCFFYTSILGGGGGLVAKSCPTLATPWTATCQAPLSIGFPSKSTGVGCHFLLQGIFLTQELNPGLLHCRQILYHLSHKRSFSVVWYVNFPNAVPGCLQKGTSYFITECFLWLPCLDYNSMLLPDWDQISEKWVCPLEVLKT